MSAAAAIATFESGRFGRGDSLDDPHRLFNNGFSGKVWRAIDLPNGGTVDAEALVRAAIAYN